jgi:hypothetical protein
MYPVGYPIYPLLVVVMFNLGWLVDWDLRGLFKRVSWELHGNGQLERW